MGPFRHDSSAATMVTALAAQIVAVGHVNSVAAAWTELATRAMTATGSVATMQTPSALVHIASAPRGHSAERLPTLGGWPAGLDLSKALRQCASDVANV